MPNPTDDLLELARESRERLVNIETKINTLLGSGEEEQAVGHPDQFFGGRTYSQHGDDLIILCLFNSLGIAKPTYLDIGAHHPTSISNTALLNKRGSRGINVEPNPNLLLEFEKHRPADVNLNVGVAPQSGELTFYMIDDYSGRNTFNKEVAEAFVRSHPQFSISKTIQVKVVTIDEIVEKFANGIYPDLLSIDVEGLDIPIIQSADFSNSRPKVICIEVENSQGDARKDEAIQTLASKGYQCIIRAVSNLIFVDKKFESLLC